MNQPKYRYRQLPRGRSSSDNRRGVIAACGAAIVLLMLAGGIGYAWQRGQATPATSSKTTPSGVTKSYAAQPAQPAKPQPAPNRCASVTVAQDIIVSISQRHLWACAGTTQVYDSAVVTGMENLPADLTPTGTYHIYAKQTGLYLNGSDSTGSWHDYVYYWMPFLSNQYGVYGFHDATWRKPSDFGAISPYSSNASHGCVELPLATAKWLYGWAPVGTAVSIVA